MNRVLLIIARRGFQERLPAGLKLLPVRLDLIESLNAGQFSTGLQRADNADLMSELFYIRFEQHPFQ